MSPRALIIGVNQPKAEKTFAPLRSAERDANDLASALRDCGFEVEALIGDQATVAAIRDAVARIREEATADSDLLIAFCGHGAWLKKPGTPNGITFLVSADYRTQRAEKDPHYYLSLSWWHEQFLDWDDPRSVLLILDCCFAGNIAREAARTSIEEAIKQRFEGVKVPTGRLRAYLAATIPDEKAYETDQGGWLTQTVVACLRDSDPQTGNGLVSVSHLVGQVRLAAKAPFRPFAENKGDYEWVLADHRAARDARRREEQAAQRAAEANRRLQHWLAPHSTARRDELLRRFVGRQQELTDLHTHIEQLRATGGYLLVTGVAGQGKSSILAKLIEMRRPKPTPAYFIRFTPGPSEQAALLGHLVAELLTIAGRQAEAPTYLPDGDSMVVLHNSFETLLKDLAQQQPLTLVIDGLDQIEPDSSGRRDLSFLPERLPPGVVLVIGTRPDDTLTPLKLRTPAREYGLPQLSQGDFAALLDTYGVRLSMSDQEDLHKALHGNAFDLDYLAQEIARTPAVERTALLQRVIANLRDLFTPTLERLRRDYHLWEQVIHPLLGVLLAAQEPLSRDALRSILGVTQDRIKTAIARLGGLLGSRDCQGQPRYGLIHLKLIDYLRSDEFAPDELHDYHARLAEWCGRDLARLWERTTNQVEAERRAYGQAHLVTHLTAAGQYDAIWRLLDDDDYGAAKRRADPSLRGYVADLDRVRQAMAQALPDDDPAQTATWLGRIGRYSLLRVQMTSRVDAWPTELFTALVAMGLGAEARDRAELLSDPARRAEVLTAIGQALIERGAAGGIDALQRARVAADAIADPEKRTRALRELAVALVRVGELEQARATFTKAQTDAAMIEHPLERILVLQALVVALVQAGYSGEAHATVKTIADPYWRIHLLKEMAVALIQIGEQDRALAILSEAQMTVAAIADPGKRSEALRTLAAALAQAGQWNAAQATAAKIDNPRERSEALGELAAALAQAGEWEAAQATAAKIKNTRERSEALEPVMNFEP